MSTSQRLERAILVALVTAMNVAGFRTACVWTEEDYQGAGGREVKRTARTAKPMTLEEVLKVFEDFDLYAPTIHFCHQGQTTWGNRGVMVVPGNGEDFISDWHSGDAAFDAVVERISAAASEGSLTLEVLS